jgi:hypothetical protein
VPFLDERGEPATHPDGNQMYRVEYDDQRNATRKMFYKDGRRVTLDAGYAGTRTRRDASGRTVEFANLNEKDQPTIPKGSFFARYTADWPAGSRTAVVRLFDERGAPALVPTRGSDRPLPMKSGGRRGGPCPRGSGIADIRKRTGRDGRSRARGPSESVRRCQQRADCSRWCVVRASERNNRPLGGPPSRRGRGRRTVTELAERFAELVRERTVPVY